MKKVTALFILLFIILATGGCAPGLPLVVGEAPFAALEALEPTPDDGGDAYNIGATLPIDRIPSRTPQPAPTTIPATDGECPFLDYEEALTIVMDTLSTEMQGDALFCGYGPMVDKVLVGGDPLTLGSVYGVAAGTLSQDQALNFFRRMATSLNRDTQGANEDIYQDVMALLAGGNTVYAIEALNEILLAIESWSTFDMTDDGLPGILFIKPDADGGPFIMFMGWGEEERLILVIAHAGADTYPMLASEGVYYIAQRLFDRNPAGDDGRRHACIYLDEKTAQAILGMAVERYANRPDQCGYATASVSKLDAGDGTEAATGLEFHIGDEAAELITDILDTIEEESFVNRTLQGVITAALDAGDYGGALALLPEVIVRSRTIEITARPEIGDGVIGLVWEQYDAVLVALLAAGDDRTIILAVAQLPDDERLDEVDELLAGVVQSVLGIVPDGEEATPAATPSPEERLSTCYGLLPADVEAILGEAATPEWQVDEQYGYCVYTSEANSDANGQTDLLPTYGPHRERHYLAATVWPVGAASDPWMYLSFAILDQSHTRLNEFLQNYSGAAALAALAEAESQRPNLERQYLAEVAGGALWYWQGTASGDHLAGLYVIAGEERIALQAFVGQDRPADQVRSALIALAERLAMGTEQP